MATITVPFTDQTLSTDDPAGAVFGVVMLVIGFVVLYFAQDLGLRGKQTLAATLGVDSESVDRPNII